MIDQFGVTASNDGKSLTSPRAKPVSLVDKENLAVPMANVIADSNNSRVFAAIKNVFRPASRANNNNNTNNAPVDFFEFQRQQALAKGVVFVQQTTEPKQQQQQSKTAHLRHWR